MILFKLVYSNERFIKDFLSRKYKHLIQETLFEEPYSNQKEKILLSDPKYFLRQNNPNHSKQSYSRNVIRSIEKFSRKSPRSKPF